MDNAGVLEEDPREREMLTARNVCNASDIWKLPIS